MSELAEALLKATNKGTNNYAAFKALTAQEIGEILTLAREEAAGSLRSKPGNTATYFSLLDQAAAFNADKAMQKGVVAYHLSAVAIGFAGYGECTAAAGHGCPVVIEYYEEQLRVLVWADINSEEPTDIIVLDGAKETAREDVTNNGDTEYDHYQNNL